MNPIAGAYAEKSPVLFISGSPGVKERNADFLLHHMVGPFECQRKVFEHITCASTILDDPAYAGFEIDRVIAAIRHYNQPGYIELPRDMVDQNIKYDVYVQGLPKPIQSNTENLTEALEKSVDWINRSRNPIILAGVEVARFGFGKQLVKFAERANIPMCCTLLGKSVVNEQHPLFLGIYCGGMSEQFVRETVENSDCVLMLGVMQTDMNLAFQPLKCEQTNVIFANTGRCRIRRSTYENVNFVDFAGGLLASNIDKKDKPFMPEKPVRRFSANGDKPVTSAALFDKVNSILDENMAIIADVGDSLFGASDLVVHHRHHFLAPAFYASMGFAVPAALGVETADKKVRPIVIVGDGAFQMTGMELSTIVRRGGRPIVFILNNGGYTTERFLLDGPFNDIQVWNFHKVCEVIGGGRGYLVTTEKELDMATNDALKNNVASIIDVRVAKMDATPALKRMMQNLATKI